MTTSIIFFLVIAGLLVAWVCYMLIKSGDVLKDIGGSDAPYKVDPPHTITTVDWAVSSKPKRSYTKRSKYWTDKRKKAVAAKARKTKPK
jgi:hypothetical protein